jgi:two-component system, NarL family, nitrate/nitrite response regulator NarL
MSIVLASRDAELISRCRRTFSAEHQLDVVESVIALNQTVVLLKPTVLFLDSTMLEKPLERGVSSIVTASRPARVIVMTPAFEEDLEIAFLKVGAKGCCRRGIDPESLQQVLNVIQNGGVWITPSLVPRLVKELQRFAEGPKARPQNSNKDVRARVGQLDNLTAREKEIVELIVEGATNKEVAQALDIGERTVKGHVSNIFRKLGVPDRLKLVLHVKEWA